MIWITVLLATAILLVLALTIATVLGWADRAFHVPVDPTVEAINAVLPGVNCGGCGYAGCAEYAQAIATGAAPGNLCTVGGQSVSAAVAMATGTDAESAWPHRAVVHCTARADQRRQRAAYHGDPTCSAANMVAGVQGCTYGCLGFGDCVTACDYDAIHIVGGVAVVDYDKCVGCRACAVVCPRNIISMVPFKANRILAVGCANLDFGNDVRAVCDVGCIGCRLCQRLSPSVHVEDNLAVIDYDRYDPLSENMLPIVEKCPMESLIFVGTGQAADDSEPPRATADFETTINHTDWRG